MSVLGIHHVTAIAGDPQRNLDFYAGLLGMRLVKRTVNFDDPQTYHFYYGDEVGTPGGILTFFPWPGARPGRVGSGQVAVTAFAVVPGAIAFWVERLLKAGLEFRGPEGRGPAGSENERVLSFKDPDGLLLEIVGHAGAAARPAWGGAPGITAEVALRGFHSVSLWVEAGEATERVLTGTLGFRARAEDGASKAFAIGDGGPGTRVEVRSIAGFGRGVGGAGTVHHVAWCVADDASELAVRAQVIAAGLHPTEVIDRQYFHSVYFREPGGVLFELATVPPGFTVDEPLAHLGEALQLPPQFESERTRIEAALPPIRVPGQSAVGTPAPNATTELGFVHRWVPGDGATLLLLHGTGGDEDDLLPLGRMLAPGAALLSPRGNVLERGAPRFFRRLAEGVFDLEDLAVRTDELAEFIAAAARRYAFDPSRLVAVGLSNGANIAASVLLKHPGVIPRAALLSPMVPFVPATLPKLAGTSVFVGAGRADEVARPEQTERLAELLRRAGASVTLAWHAGGHTVSADEIEALRRWLAA